MEVLEVVAKYGISPATAILAVWAYDKLVAQKRNGGLAADKLEAAITKAVAAALEASRKDTTAHLDLALTQNFHWLLRDLEHKVTEEHEKTRKDWTNALQRFMLDLELFVLRGQPPDRRPRE